MNLGSQSGSTDRDPVPPGDLVMLMECDSQAHILWMSDAARAAFGAVENLAGALRSVAPSGPEGLLRLASAARFSPVFQRGDSIWISAELAERAEATALQEARALLGIQDDFLRHYFRLQILERELSARIRRLRRPGGAQAVHQVERERRRLGRELHTGVGQLLAAIRLQVEIIDAQHSQPPVPVKEALERIAALTREALESVRSISSRIHPPEWQRLTLEDALRQLWDLSGVPQRFEAALRIQPLPREPVLEVKILMYRAAQEAISNLVRHSRATRAEMALEVRGGRLTLTVQDNGVGFDAGRLFTAPANVASGIGLRSIRDQAEAVGGKFVVQSGAKGTKLDLSTPISAETA